MRWLVVTIALLALTRSLAASPDAARYSADASRLFWFVVVADTHIGASFQSGNEDTVRLSWVVGEAYQVIRPVRIFICGDLVDASGSLGVPMAQRPEEWEEYRQIMDLAKMTPGILVDLPGNHDQYGDKGMTWYLKKSVQGSADGQTQHSVVYDPGYASYHFLTIATPANDGLMWPWDNAGLDEGELAFAGQAMDANSEAALQFVFGHHPLGYDGMPGSGLLYGQDEIRNLMKSHHVLAYFYGHTHEYRAEWHDQILQFNVASLGKSNGYHVAVAAVDNDSLSVRVFKAMEWPYVVITAPADTDLGGGNPYAYKVPRGWTTAPVRALVFARDPAQAVEFSIDSAPWVPMAEGAPGVWKGQFDATQLAFGPHTLSVRALPWPDAAHKIRFEVADVPVPTEPEPSRELEPVPEQAIVEETPPDVAHSEPTEAVFECLEGCLPPEATPEPAPEAPAPEAVPESGAADSLEPGSNPDLSSDFLGAESEWRADPSADVPAELDPTVPNRTRPPSVGGCTTSSKGCAPWAILAALLLLIRARPGCEAGAGAHRRTGRGRTVYFPDRAQGIPAGSPSPNRVQPQHAAAGTGAVQLKFGAGIGTQASGGRSSLAPPLACSWSLTPPSGHQA